MSATHLSVAFECRVGTDIVTLRAWRISQPSVPLAQISDTTTCQRPGEPRPRTNMFRYRNHSTVRATRSMHRARDLRPEVTVANRE